jgi:glutathione S-transferase
MTRPRLESTLRAMSELTLYVDDRWCSPYAMNSFICLKHKGLPFSAKTLDLRKQEAFTPAYRDASITAKVPALVHDGFWIAESMAIAEYIAETFPAPKYARLFPEDLKERARARQIMMWLRSDLMPIREERPTTTIFIAPTEKPLSEAGERAAEELVRVASQVISEERTTLFREWCIADPDLGLMLQRLNLNGYRLPAKLRAYAEAQWKLPAIQEWVSKKRPA